MQCFNFLLLGSRVLFLLVLSLVFAGDLRIFCARKFSIVDHLINFLAKIILHLHHLLVLPISTHLRRWFPNTYGYVFPTPMATLFRSRLAAAGLMSPGAEAHQGPGDSRWRCNGDRTGDGYWVCLQLFVVRKNMNNGMIMGYSQLFMINRLFPGQTSLLSGV